MSFSVSDLANIKAAAQADAAALGYWTAGNPGELAAYLNKPSATMLTRKDVSNTELFHALVASEVLTLTAPQLTLLQLAGAAGTIDFTNANVAGGLGSIFATTTKTYQNIMTLAQRVASRLEAIFTTGGVCSHYGEQIDAATVQEAMNG